MLLFPPSSSSMDFGTTHLAVPRQFSLLNALESLTEVRERGRNRFLSCRDTTEEELVCPRAYRAGSGMLPATALDTGAKPCRRLRGATSLPFAGEAGREILDILYSKENCDGSSGSGSPNKYLNGSPPCRANNPMIHDSVFTLKRTVSSSVARSQKSSCGSSSLGWSGSSKSNSSVNGNLCNSSYVSKPTIRIEGFASATTADPNRGIPAYA